MTKVKFIEPETEWFNVREKRPSKRHRVLVKCGEHEYPAMRMGFVKDYWVYDSGFKIPFVEYDLWRPI